jgi:hypothetical protein
LSEAEIKAAQENKFETIKEIDIIGKTQKEELKFILNTTNETLYEVVKNAGSEIELQDLGTV